MAGVDLVTGHHELGRGAAVILEVGQARHERVAEQMAQPEQLLGVAVRVRHVLAWPEHGLVLEQPVEHVDHLPHRARSTDSRVCCGNPGWHGAQNPAYVNSTGAWF
jgi:hypothetical protein